MGWEIIIEKTAYVLVSVALYFVIKFLQDKGILEKVKKIQVNDEIKEYATRLGILAAQQIFSKYEGEVKYDYAVNYIVNYLSKRDISLEADEIKGLIEANLLRIKSEMISTWNNEDKDKVVEK